MKTGWKAFHLQELDEFQNDARENKDCKLCSKYGIHGA